MADPRFFENAGPFSLSELVGRAEARLADGVDSAREVADVAALEDAGPEHVSFLDNPKYIESFRKTKAGACFVHPAQAGEAPAGTACLVSETPYRSYALAAQAFYPQEALAEGGVSAEAHVAPSAVLADGVIVEPGAVIGERAKIGRGTVIRANAVIGPGVEIGEDCDIGANASVTHALLGNKVYIYSGARIGQRGFGFALDPSGYVRVPQLGRVLIEDDVEVGANTTVDRGTVGDTVIGQGSRIDNLVQIAHGVKIGRGCVIVAQTGISGSTELGDFVMTGGQAGLTGHLKIGSGVRIGAQSGVMRDVPAGEEIMGSPAVPSKQFMRQVATLSRIAKGRKGKAGNE